MTRNETTALVDSQITLRDGRTLGYAEYGMPDGKPVFYLHGLPGTRLLHPAAVMAGAANTRIITLDRPGYGRSDTNSHGGMVDRADEVGELADALGIDRFAVVGVSGGGPYAAACGWRLCERVTAVGLISSPAPLPYGEPDDTVSWDGDGFSDAEIQAARSLPWPEFLNWFKEQQGNAIPDIEQLMTSFPSGLPVCDQHVFALPEVQAFFRIGFPEVFRQGLEGWAWDSWTLARPWGFSIRDIGVQTYLWHGLDDGLVRVSQGRYLAATIPNCAATFYPDTGHLLPPYRWNEILTTLARVTEMS